MKKSSKIPYIVVIVGLLVVIGYLVATNGSPNSNISVTPSVQSPGTLATPTPLVGNGSVKTYVFNQFHGEEVEGGGFEFDYPAGWYNSGQYFSPMRINFYDLFSVDAPVYFDLIDKELFDTSDLKHQITTDKRRSPDTSVKIDGLTFKKYDLIDYGSNGGESSGRVMIYLGPQISFNGDDYYLVFRWEENPLTIPISGNDPIIFEQIVSSLKFVRN